MKILHIIKKTHDLAAYETALRQAEDDQQEVSILLLHDAVYTPPKNYPGLFSCRDDVEARGIKCPGTAVSYEEIVNLLVESDSVVSWPSL